MKNTFGNVIQFHSFGESHGPAIGCVLDGFPAGILFEEDLLKNDLNRRRPGQWQDGNYQAVSPRKEADEPEILSGIYQGKTLGTPICVIIRNQDARSEDYEKLPPRKGHADQVWIEKYGHTDPRGGGRSSGRETAARVIAGAFAKMFLKKATPQLQIYAYLRSIGPFQLTDQELESVDPQSIDSYPGRFPSSDRKDQIQNGLESIRSRGESWGAIMRLEARGVPKGLGQPVFHKIKSELAHALMGIGAVMGVQMVTQKDPIWGTEFHQNEQYGGILGGITTGDPLIWDIVFKPTSSILDVAKKGRHDPCVAIRAVPVAEAMAAWVLADHWLWSRLDRFESVISVT